MVPPPLLAVFFPTLQSRRFANYPVAGLVGTLLSAGNSPRFPPIIFLSMFASFFSTLSWFSNIPGARIPAGLVLNVSPGSQESLLACIRLLHWPNFGSNVPPGLARIVGYLRLVALISRRTSFARVGPYKCVPSSPPVKDEQSPAGITISLVIAIPSLRPPGESPHMHTFAIEKQS